MGRSVAGDHEAEDVPSSGFLEGTGAILERCTRRVDIVDDYDIAIAHDGSIGTGECTAHVVQSFGAMLCFRLCGGGTLPDEGAGRVGHQCTGGNTVSDERRMVGATIPESGRMHWHRHQQGTRGKKP